MSEKTQIVVAGLGEVGKPLLELVASKYEVLAVDLASVPPRGPVDVLHVCYPFQIPDFIGETVRYIDLYQPALTIINSTVAIGTTRAISERSARAVVNSPVRGKHARMVEEMRRYTKFVGTDDPVAAEHACRHFGSVGMRTRVLSSPEATELAKLTETTYFGLLIAWAQEIERYCDLLGQQYDEVTAFFEEIQFLPPVKYVPGVIGGHCVMPNIRILSKCQRSDILEAIQASNQMKMEREARLLEPAPVGAF